MSQIFSKIAKIGLWVLVPTLFISGTKLDNQPVSSMLNDGDYTMQITGNLNNQLSGEVNFETAIETTSKGISFSTLKLKLDNKEQVLPHSMEFLISKENISVCTIKKEKTYNAFFGIFVAVYFL